MRIIAGKYKSRIIKFPKDIDIRPTKDNVRLAIFNILGDQIFDKIIFDLFSGSGAYGIEAFSRGAKYCYFNDKSYAAYNCIKDNLNSLMITNYSLTKLDYTLAISSLIQNQKKIDIIFLDPPYFKNFYNDVLVKLIPLLTEESIVVLEVDKRVDLNISNEYEIIKEKIYSDQKILFLSLKGEVND